MENLRKIARDLLKHIGAPPGTVNVLVRGPRMQPRLVVTLSPSLRIPETRLPRRFGGLDVAYEERRAARLLRAKAILDAAFGEKAE